MKKRVIALLLVICMLTFCFASAAAATAVPENSIRSAGTVYGGLTSKGGSTYALWGKITSVAGEPLTVQVDLYRGSIYITTVSGSGIGPNLYVEKSVTLSSGTYRLEIHGTTATHSPSTTKYVVI